MKRSPKIAVVASMLVATATARAVVISFDNTGLSAGETYTGHVENGFSIVSFGHRWGLLPGFGTPRPCIGNGPIGDPVGVTVARAGGGLFTVQSYDKYSRYLITDCVFEGYRAGQLIYSNEQFSFQGGFRTVTNPDTAQIDFVKLIIKPHALGYEDVELDTIVVTPVPEPSTFACLIAGLFVIRSRRT